CRDSVAGYLAHRRHGHSALHPHVARDAFPSRHSRAGGACRVSMAATRTLFGFHAVTGRLRQQPGSIQAIYIASARQDARTRQLLAVAQANGRQVHFVDEARLHALSGSDRHQGVVAVVDAAMPHVTVDDVLDHASEPPLLVVLDGVTDPHNLGACLRNADAFGAHAVIVPKDRAVGVNATVAKAASGAADTIPVISVTNLAR